MKRVALILAILLIPGTAVWAVDYYEAPPGETVQTQAYDKNEWNLRLIDTIEYVDGTKIRAIFTNADSAIGSSELFKSILTLGLRTNQPVFLFTTDTAITGYGIVRFP